VAALQAQNGQAIVAEFVAQLRDLSRHAHTG
jgi:hypothetical protein